MPFEVTAVTTVSNDVSIVIAQGLQGELGMFSLCSGVNAATAVLRTGGASGSVLAKLGSGIGLSTEITLEVDTIHFSDGLHLTITGTTPTVTVGYKDQRTSS